MNVALKPPFKDRRSPRNAPETRERGKAVRQAAWQGIVEQFKSAASEIEAEDVMCRPFRS
jgi:hypothetical protein